MPFINGPGPPEWTARTIEHRVAYWRELWQELVDFRHGFRGLSLKSPHLLLREIADEADDGFRNKDSAKYLKSQLYALVEEDPALRADGAAFKVLRQELEKRRPGHLRALARSAMVQFIRGSYSCFHCEELKRIILTPRPKDGASTLIFTSQVLIIELVMLGYSWDYIRSRPSVITAGCRNMGSAVVTDYPCEVPIDPYKEPNGEVDVVRYNEAVEAHVSGLTTSDRLERFARFFQPEHRTTYYIFQVEGLRPDFQDPSREMELGNVTLYSPSARKFLYPNADSILNADEKFRAEDGAVFINAAVAVSSLAGDDGSGLTKALQDTDRALGFISAYIGGGKPFKPNAASFLRGDDEKKVAESTSYFGNRMSDVMESANLKDAGIYLKQERLDAASALLDESAESRSDIQRRLLLAFRWLRKATESAYLEDRLLFSWVVIETLLGADDAASAMSSEDDSPTRIERAMDLIPAVALRGFRWSQLSFVHDRLVNELKSSSPSITFPEDLKEAAGLVWKPYTSYSLAKMRPHIPKLREHLKGQRLDDWLRHAEEFYSTPKIAARVYEDRLKSIKEQVVLIYRLRNRIVHSAHYEHPFLSYYARAAEGLAETATLAVFDAFVDNRNAVVSEVLLRCYSETQILIERLNRGETVDLLAD